MKYKNIFLKQYAATYLPVTTSLRLACMKKKDMATQSPIRTKWLDKVLEFVQMAGQSPGICQAICMTSIVLRVA